MGLRIENGFGAAIFGIAFICAACSQDSRGFFYHTSGDHYYTSEIFSNDFREVYGEWILQGISGGLELTASPPEFERIVIQRIGIFKVFRNDSLLGYGRINVKERNDNSIKISFLPDRGVGQMAFYSSERELFLRENHLNLFASCCEQFNYHFVRHK